MYSTSSIVAMAVGATPTSAWFHTAGSERGVLGHVSADRAWKLPAFVLAEHGRRLHRFSHGERLLISLTGGFVQLAINGID